MSGLCIALPAHGGIVSEKTTLGLFNLGKLLVRNNIEHGLMTKPAQAMPDDVKHKDPVKAYRNYYRVHKKHLAKWTNREVPRWALEKV